MTNKQVFQGSLRALAGIILCVASVSLAAAQGSKLRILQTNSAGDNIHIIDPATNKVVGEIKGSKPRTELWSPRTAVEFTSVRKQLTR